MLVAISAVRKGASSEGMTIRDYCWRGHDPTAVAVMMEVCLAVFTANYDGNHMTWKLMSFIRLVVT